MFGLNFFKATPSTYVMLFRNGQLTKEGAGANFYYASLGASIINVPLASREIPFAFRMKSQDYQDLTIQGQITYQITEPKLAAKMLDFTVNNKGQYLSEDPEKIEERIIRSLQVLVRNEIEKRDLVEALSFAKALTEAIQSQLPTQSAINSMGITVNELAFTQIQPSPETAKALEAEAREEMLKQADTAIYSRRLASIEQEQQVKEKELDTEKAIMAKQQNLEKQKLQAKREQQQTQFTIDQEKLEAQTLKEEERSRLVELENTNAQSRADSKAYAIEKTLRAYESIDTERLRIMSMSGQAPEQLIAQAIENLTQGENRVGNLNLSPELLQSLVK
ncbi:SPFH domain-containing protein [Thaumasiovibrio subtropicus]|uniref:SPFH domain-containing protein n=1 Tax=Thaumasiovibrio subtropicus TaxID=1891207 RepID=UPI000B35DE0F|nr:SPFH domain-containing protein [Thaumasiovibrio subtropicus]